MKSLSTQQIEHLRLLMLSIKDKLEEQLNANLQATAIVKLDQSSVGRVSRIDAIQQQHMAVSTRGKTKQRLGKILLTLQTVKQDDYGYCRRCDQVIAFERLCIQPESELCLQCQSQLEG
ncbi:MAG: molecular chaperone DnaK [SAR86 cluster bacterium]|uniref:Molecular chaperone DnaK n=1 Tax=SAR86 cluster bacterium TaxID=2030880 RepID=A0A2A4MKL0_9GAMM|nr:MAG: molecular chaperone DnaK [SAR86 cluster bacterium]